jgi:hypothetical protein
VRPLGQQVKVERGQPAAAQGTPRLLAIPPTVGSAGGAIKSFARGHWRRIDHSTPGQAWLVRNEPVVQNAGWWPRPV